MFRFRYYGYSINNLKYYLITELSEFGSLRDVLRSRLLKNETELLFLLKQISNGLEFLHNDYRNVVNGRPPIAHRDFKSENILYLNSNQIVICDFAMSIKIDQNENYPNEQQQVFSFLFFSFCI
jgi:serine/threonine protein kinase